MLKSLLLLLLFAGFGMTVNAETGQQTQTGNSELNKSVLYEWTDDNGVNHITDDLDMVPKQYRDTAAKLTQPNREKADQGQPVRPRQGIPSGNGAAKKEADEKAYWQKRLRDAEHRLADAEKRHRALVQQREELLQHPGGAASGHLTDPVELDKVEQEIKDAQNEIDAAQKDLDEGIPEAARKAGVPPGWLRE